MRPRAASPPWAWAALSSMCACWASAACWRTWRWARTRARTGAGWPPCCAWAGPRRPRCWPRRAARSSAAAWAPSPAWDRERGGVGKRGDLGGRRIIKKKKKKKIVEGNEVKKKYTTVNEMSTTRDTIRNDKWSRDVRGERMSQYKTEEHSKEDSEMRYYR